MDEVQGDERDRDRDTDASRRRQDPGPERQAPLSLLHRPPFRVARWSSIWAQSQAIQDHVPKTAVPAPEPRRLAVIHRRPRLSGRTKGRW
ncbi:hypothetical protein Trisim1_000519 [Trichoderma cf. simile WF8]